MSGYDDYQAYLAAQAAKADADAKAKITSQNNADEFLKARAAERNKVLPTPRQTPSQVTIITDIETGKSYNVSSPMKPIEVKTEPIFIQDTQKTFTVNPASSQETVDKYFVTLPDKQLMTKTDFESLEPTQQAIAKEKGYDALIKFTSEQSRGNAKMAQLDTVETQRLIDIQKNALYKLESYKSGVKQVNPLTGVSRGVTYDIAKALRNGEREDTLINAGFNLESITQARQYNADNFGTGLPDNGKNIPKISQEEFIDNYLQDNYGLSRKDVMTVQFRDIPDTSPEYGKRLAANNKLLGEATESYIKKFGTMAVVSTGVAKVGSFVFSPARALRPEVTIKDISKGEWIAGAAQVALFVVAPIAGSAIRGTAGIATSKAIQLAAGGVFLKDTVENWSVMSPTERTISLAMDTLIIGSALPKGAIVKGAKATGEVIVKGSKTTVKYIGEGVQELKLNPQAGNVKLDLPETVVNSTKISESMKPELKAALKNLENAASLGDEWSIRQAAKNLKDVAKKIDNPESREGFIKYAEKIENNPESVANTINKAKEKITEDQIQKNINTIDDYTRIEKGYEPKIQPPKPKQKTLIITKEKPKIEDYPVKERPRIKDYPIKEKAPLKDKAKLQNEEDALIRRQNELKKNKARLKDEIEEIRRQKVVEDLYRPIDKTRLESKFEANELRKAKENLKQSTKTNLDTKTELKLKNQSETKMKLKEQLKTKLQEQLALKLKLKNLLALKLQLNLQLKERTKTQLQNKTELNVKSALKTIPALQIKPKTEDKTKTVVTYTPSPEENEKRVPPVIIPPGKIVPPLPPPPTPPPGIDDRQPPPPTPPPKQNEDQPPPPPPPPPKKEDGKKPIALSSKGGEKEIIHTPAAYAAAVTWKQGLGYWIVFPDKTTEWSRNKPSGVKEIPGPDKNTPSATIQVYQPKTGNKRIIEFDADMGIQDIRVRKQGKRILSIQFKSDRGQRTSNPVRLGRPGKPYKSVKQGRIYYTQIGKGKVMSREPL